MIFNYHQITEDRDSYLYAVTADMLAEHLNAVTHHPSRFPFQITFDDGHITQLRNGAPVLQRFGCPAKFFVTVGWVGVDPEYFTWDDIREVHQLGYTIGTHGWSHKFFTQCSPKELERELVDSKKALEDTLGFPITTLSFPGGRHSKTVIDACAKAGYDEVYTSEAWAKPVGGPVKVFGRMVVTGDMTAERLVQLLNCNGRQPLASRIMGSSKATAKTILGDNLYYRIWSVLVRSRRREGMEETVEG